MSSKGARSKRLSNLNSRVITTVLKNEKLADRDLQAKLKSINANERKNMLRLGETSLDVKYDWRRWRNSIHNEEEDVPAERGTPPGSPVLTRHKMPGLRIRSSMSESSDTTTKQLVAKLPSSPQLGRRPTIVIEDGSQNSESGKNCAPPNCPSMSSVSGESDEADQTHHDNQVPDEPPGSPLTPPPNLYQRRCTAPALTHISPKLLLRLAKGLPEAQLSRDTTLDKLPPISRKLSISSPDLERTGNDVPTHTPTPPGSPRMQCRAASPKGSICLDVPGKSALGEVVDKLSATSVRPSSARSRSPSPSRHSLEPPRLSTARRKSEPMPIDFSKLPSNSVLRKACTGGEEKSSTLNPVPVSPRMMRRLSGHDDVLQDRVDDFLKSFASKT